MNTDQKEKRNDEYNKYVKRVTPTHCLPANMLKAFVLGGIICTIGQLIVNTGTQYFGLKSDEASAWCSMILILISCVLTSLNLYAPLANWGGAGALVPITGFANGVCSSACEFQVEGQVFGRLSDIQDCRSRDTVRHIFKLGAWCDISDNNLLPVITCNQL